MTVAGILDLLLTSIWERRRELALWRLIGADHRVVLRSIVIESLTIGVLAVILGIVVGLVTSAIWVKINYRYLLGYDIDFHLAPGTIAWFAMLVVTLTLLVGYGGAREATRQPILDGIRAD